MRTFIKKFWGFGAHWPIVSFGQKGSLDALLAKSEPGDLMAFVGTLGPPTAEAERGRLLGLAQFDRKLVHSRTALPTDVFAAAPKGENGDIKWPHAVLMTLAWCFTASPLPLMKDILGRQLTMAAISNAELLSPVEQANVLLLAREEFNVALTKESWDQREEIAAIVGSGGTMGPVPSSFRADFIRDSFKPASTYAFRFGAKDVWKIGWTHDPKERLKSLNAHVPSEELGGQCWGGGVIQNWPSAEQAYAMEQKVLNSFGNPQKFGERLHCTEQQLHEIWIKVRRGT